MFKATPFANVHRERLFAKTNRGVTMRCGKPADSSTVFCGHVHADAIDLHNSNMRNACKVLGGLFAAEERLYHYDSGQPYGKATSG